MFVVEPFGVFPSAFFMTQFELRSINIIRTHIAKHGRERRISNPWEQIFYGEFDGKRRKRVLVKIIGE